MLLNPGYTQVFNQCDGHAGFHWFVFDSWTYGRHEKWLDRSCEKEVKRLKGSADGDGWRGNCLQRENGYRKERNVSQYNRRWLEKWKDGSIFAQAQNES